MLGFDYAILAPLVPVDPCLLGYSFSRIALPCPLRLTRCISGMDHHLPRAHVPDGLLKYSVQQEELSYDDSWAGRLIRCLDQLPSGNFSAVYRRHSKFCAHVQRSWRHCPDFSTAFKASSMEQDASWLGATYSRKLRFAYAEAASWLPNGRKYCFPLMVG